MVELYLILQQTFSSILDVHLSCLLREFERESERGNVSMCEWGRENNVIKSIDYFALSLLYFFFILSSLFFMIMFSELRDDEEEKFLCS